MYLRKLSKSELIVMKFIWNLDTKVKSYQVIDYMKEKYSWSKKTTLKTLSKLSNKRFIYVQETSQCTYYTISIKEDTYSEFISQKIHKLLRCNSIKGILASLFQEELTDEKLISLEEWVKNWEEDD
ncbi:TPA: BlaI/MecI/CopY family transcriptional regulator [Clostridioides difficile]|uniref:Copper transport repressor, CopY/TcrY family n=1 Tax=Clostridioides difficile TaxID=1496 RepID=A0A9X8WRR4_CLODI|nr:BlaI/MecI/CopY family transcriptional regulator [Clostridioides difficile]EGT4145678.1 BlaI/MecI/CopY family transcriptional regulator [Clostridioides difficile]EGT4846830.1 BlaI/MecI/CopY family transcriptional regulator [Clostridioides difficile]EGT4929409.1 BlaI/MecI/CopY family transcriptional regulator [Clostridioides difficile]EQH15506.1 penicillinase repressor family protein [Clostridioides difficile DA00210]MBJ9761033.1 BlaI/MecI/CopY family transcriptional regulator [Clostridioides